MIATVKIQLRIKLFRHIRQFYAGVLFVTISMVGVALSVWSDAVRNSWYIYIYIYVDLIMVKVIAIVEIITSMYVAIVHARSCHPCKEAAVGHIY